MSSPLKPEDAFNLRDLTKGLTCLGDYVYAYYRLDEYLPFYVGKGRKNRVLDHWRRACKGHEGADSTLSEDESEIEKQQVRIIREDILNKEHEIPIIKILSYNLQDTPPGEVYSVVERTLQTAFGIQKVFDTAVGSDRLSQPKGSLVQIRDNSASAPPLSLEAAYCKGLSLSNDRIEVSEISNKHAMPVLLVGLSKTYDPSYRPSDLESMARMWWNLEHPAPGNFERLRGAKDAILVGWVRMKKSSCPQIVGIWKILPKSFLKHENYEKKPKWGFSVAVDYGLRKEWLGRCLNDDGNSNKFLGPRYFFPERQ